MCTPSSTPDALSATIFTSPSLSPMMSARPLPAKRWTEVLAMFQPPLGYEIRDLTLTLADDLAFGHSLNRMSGTLKNGHRTGFWLRPTTGSGGGVTGWMRLDMPIRTDSKRTNSDSSGFTATG